MMNNEGENRKKPDSIYDCIVIGAGISGISFAHQLAKVGKTVLILEEENTVGGQISTYVSRHSPDFWTELGAHTCYNSYTHLLSIVDDMAAEKDILSLEKCKYMLYDDGKIKSPFSKISFLSLMFNGLRVVGRSKDGRTVKEYFRPIVGASNYDKLFTKMFRAVISQEADDYPAEIFLKRRSERRKDVVRKYSFSKGLSSFLKAIIDHDGLEIIRNASVTNVNNIENDLFEVETRDGRKFLAHNVAVATNPRVAACLLDGLESDVANILNSITLLRSETLNVIVRKEDISCPQVAGIIPTSDQFLSVVSRDVSKHPSLRAFSFHFKDDKSESEKLDLICEVINIDAGLIAEKSQVTHVLPALRKQHINIIEDIRAKQKSANVYLLGNYFYGLSLEDCVHRSFDEAKRFIASNT